MHSRTGLIITHWAPQPQPPAQTALGHHLLIRWTEGYSAFLTASVMKITDENNRGVQQFESEEPFVVTNPLRICHHLVKTQMSSREPLSSAAGPMGRAHTPGSPVRMDVVFLNLPHELSTLCSCSYVSCGCLKGIVPKTQSRSSKNEK